MSSVDGSETSSLFIFPPSFVLRYSKNVFRILYYHTILRKDKDGGSTSPTSRTGEVFGERTHQGCQRQTYLHTNVHMIPSQFSSSFLKNRYLFKSFVLPAYCVKVVMW